MAITPRCIQSTSTDPFVNLAIGSYLQRTVSPNELVIYFWQNGRSVVIGRNQNASAECHIDQLEMSGGVLARRRSGGSAVYHDLGNLNYAFISSSPASASEETEVILSAVRSLGIQAEHRGRNALVTSDGRKFSGDAFMRAGRVGVHYGTIMVDVDTNAFARYLTASPANMHSWGVPAVRSHVSNLCEFNHGISTEDVRRAIHRALCKALETSIDVEDASVLDAAAIDAARKRFASHAWIYQGERRFDESYQAQFDWGTVRVDLTVVNEVVRDLAFFSNGLDADLFLSIPQLLIGSSIRRNDLVERLLAGGLPYRFANDIARLIAT